MTDGWRPHGEPPSSPLLPIKPVSLSCITGDVQRWSAAFESPAFQLAGVGSIQSQSQGGNIGAQDAGSHFSSAASAARRTTRPGNIFPPPRTHFFSSTLAPSISPALIFRRKVEPASRVAPRL